MKNAEGKWQRFDTNGLSNWEIIRQYEIIHEEMAQGRVYELTAEEMAQAIGSNPALKGDPYNPKEVEARKPEWDALKDQCRTTLERYSPRGMV